MLFQQSSLNYSLKHQVHPKRAFRILFKAKFPRLCQNRFQITRLTPRSPPHPPTQVCFFAVEGVEAILRLQKCGIKATYIYVSPPSMETYATRLNLTSAAVNSLRQQQQLRHNNGAAAGAELIARRIRDAKLMEEFSGDADDSFHLRVTNTRVHDAYLKIKETVSQRCVQVSYSLAHDVIAAHTSRLASFLDLSALLK